MRATLLILTLTCLAPRPAAAEQVAPAPAGAPADSDPPAAAAIDALKHLELGVGLDTYYGWNMNRPIGRVNLLRAYDVTSNNFSLSQATVIVASPVDPDAGRRFGGRLDLQYGAATETLQGSLSNEPRPQAYRPIFQAFGTYVFPVAAGLTVDFGKWASAIGYEGNYTKDQITYSRSFWFNYLPFYHMGARVGLRLNDALTLNYWITNGTQQTEAFNNYKDQMIGAVLRPQKHVAWTLNYYLGQEHPDVQPVGSSAGPALPTQAGLSVTPIDPAPDGRLHILDSYVEWQATPGTLVAIEGDYVVNRQWEEEGLGRSAAPATVAGGAAYARRQLTRHTAAAVRVEYLRDRDGLFSGTSEILSETTLTYEFRVEGGFLLRAEWRRDAARSPFFLTAASGSRSTDQQTLTAGLIWWWGNKRGPW